MTRRIILAFSGIYLFLYVFNYLTPMSFGDDYLYSFVWQGHSMFTPISENAVRISSWNDLFVSQISHYLTWSGRTVNHTIAQLSLWAGKDIFNFFNAFVGTLLVVEIYWCINKGNVSADFKVSSICWIFFCLWSFSPGFAPVYFWLDGACNYLWTAVILLGFLIIYIQKYYRLNDTFNTTNSFVFCMFFWGVFSGWTNENSICCIILMLVFFLHRCSNRKIGIEKWMYTGLAGLATGYSLLILAPGNFARLQIEQLGSDWSLINTVSKNVSMLLMIFFFQLFLWYFVLKSLSQLKNSYNALDEQVKHELVLVKVLCVLSTGMTGIMLFSPVFPPRSGFPGTIPLIIAAGILLRLQRDYNLALVNKNAKKFLFCIGCFYFIMTSLVTFHNYYLIHEQMQELLGHLKYAQKNEVLQIKPFRKINDVELYLSGFHLLGYDLSENENEWRNVAFSRYYGIKGIRMVHDKEK